MECAEESAGENGDCGMRRRGPRAEPGWAGLAKGEGGMTTRGDSGLERLEPPTLAREKALWLVEVVLTEALES